MEPRINTNEHEIEIFAFICTKIAGKDALIKVVKKEFLFRTSFAVRVKKKVHLQHQKEL